MIRSITALLVGAAAPAAAGDVALTLTSAGRPLPGAVVMLHAAGPAKGGFRPTQPLRMVQQDIAFTPHVLIVPVAADVIFPNRDRVRHHVFSFSPVKRFELKLYGREEARQVRFDQPGVVPIGCNIHDRMTAYIVVVDTPHAAQSDARGSVKWAGIGAGPGTVQVWHPRLRAPKNQMTLRLDVPAAGALVRTVAVELRPGTDAQAQR